MTSTQITTCRSESPAWSSLAAALADPAVSIEEAALVLARDAYPGLDVGRYLGQLDDIAAPLVPRIEAMRGGRGVAAPAVAALLGEHLWKRLGFRGNDAAYYDPRNSYLNDVLDTRVGIPISLAVVVLAVARRCGVPAEGIGFPGHFLVRLGGPVAMGRGPNEIAGGCYVDPFRGVRVLDRPALERLLVRVAGPGSTLSPEHLSISDRRAMIVRMLTNLRGIFAGGGHHAHAMLACDRLVDLGAGLSARRDRGLHALALGAHEVARVDLETYLAGRPKAADQARVRDALARAKAGGVLH
jgi:regulator of sirC expression with transglutaminase-like and TPR domain